MPTYVYRREDGTTFEIEQRITEPALETCPETGQRVERVISGGTGLIFKGSGFYLTDYARNGQTKGADASKNGTGASEDKTSSSPSASEKSDTGSTKEAA